MSNKTTKSSKKRERRKTLEEYFLDSPPELAVENAFQVSALNLVQHYSFIAFSHDYAALSDRELSTLECETRIIISVYYILEVLLRAVNT